MAQVAFTGNVRIVGPRGGTYAAKILVLDQSNPPQVLAQKTGPYSFIGSDSSGTVAVTTDAFSAIPGTPLTLSATLIDGAGSPVASISGSGIVPGVAFSGTFTPSAKSVRMVMV